MKLLIGSCGGLTGFYLSKEFKDKYPCCYIYGIDSNNSFATKKYLNEFIESPNTGDEKNFVSFLIEILNSENIEYYFPTHSKETKVVSKYEKEIREKTKTKFIISPYETYVQLDDKKRANASLGAIGIYVPKLYLTMEDVKFPAFIKPLVGSGSRNSFVINDINDYVYFSQKNQENLFMENIVGDEYTVDAFFDNNGNLVAYNQRIRIKQLGGATIYTKNEFSKYDCYNDLLKISNKYIFKGVVNFQFILRERQAYYIDINLRYASGGLPLSVESGLNVAKFLIEVLNNSTIDKTKFQSDRKNRYTMRYFDEEFVVE